MASRKDLLKAHSFTAQRMVTSLVEHNPDDQEPPLRRGRMGLFISIMIGAVLLGGTILIGMLRGNSPSSWKDGNSVILDTSSGVLYAYISERDQLVPMTDIASAKLFVAGPNPSGDAPNTISVKGKDLQGIKHAGRQGIPYAPYQLPSTKQIAPYPLRVCSSAPTQSKARFTTVEFRANVPQRSGPNPSIVAQASNGDQFIIANGVAHKLFKPQANQNSPLATGIPIVVPGDRWLRAIPQGADILPLQIPYGSAPAISVPDASWRVGSLASNGDGGPDTHYYIMLKDGLNEIPYLDMMAYSVANGDLPISQITDSEVAQMTIPAGQQEIGTPGLPYPKPVGPEGETAIGGKSVCATYTAEAPDKPIISVDDETPFIPPEQQASETVADLVIVPPQNGALLRTTNAGDTNRPPSEVPGATFLITQGMRYGIPNEGSRRALGYAEGVTIMAVPGGLIDLIPSGLQPGQTLSYACTMPNHPECQVTETKR